jgi:hypothetical protein
MKQPRHSSLWRRPIALLALLSLLLLCGMSASHVHDTSTNGRIRHECQLCAAGRVNLTLTLGNLLLAALVLIFFLPVIPAVQPCLAHRHCPGDPRSPPVLS